MNNQKEREQTMNASEVKLGEYADAENTTYENVMQFLKDVERATLPEIVGATGGAWATCHGAVHLMIEDGRVVIDGAAKPWEYVWRGK